MYSENMINSDVSVLIVPERNLAMTSCNSISNTVITVLIFCDELDTNLHPLQ